MKRIVLASVIAAALAAGPLHSETCLSPYIKGLRATGEGDVPVDPAQRRGADYLSVIDVNIASPTYGKILKKVEVGSKGNEAHHMGYTDDRTRIWAASLNSNRFFIFDVGTDPMNPRLVRTIDDVAKVSGLSGPHTPYAIPGRILVSMASGPTAPGREASRSYTTKAISSRVTRRATTLRDGDQAGVQPHDHRRAGYRRRPS
jgi:selenium-binding protein 1